MCVHETLLSAILFKVNHILRLPDEQIQVDKTKYIQNIQQMKI